MKQHLMLNINLLLFSGLAAYPCYVEEYSALRHPVVIGILTGSFAMLAMVAIVLLWRCRHKIASFKERSKDKRDTKTAMFTTNEGQQWYATLLAPSRF